MKNLKFYNLLLSEFIIVSVKKSRKSFWLIKFRSKFHSKFHIYYSSKLLTKFYILFDTLNDIQMVVPLRDIKICVIQFNLPLFIN